MKLYINQLFRYGDTTGHSYCSPIFGCPYLAEITKVLMVGYRGGKYEAETFEFDLVEKEQYYLAEIFTENEENKQIQLFDNIEQADMWLASFSFHQKKLSIVKIKNDLININIIEAHEYLDRISLNSQSKLRDLYEQYLRKYYYY
jgi:hypothetical protein